MKNTTGNEFDKIEIKQNGFVELKTDTSDITILPVSVNVDFLAKLRMGPQFLYGPTQEVRSRMLGVSLEFQECQHVKREHSLTTGKGQAPKEESDDEDMDDDDEQPQAPKMKVSGLAGLLCGFIPKINEKFAKEREEELHGFLAFKGNGMIEQWLGVQNEWTPFAEKMGINVERCGGVETMQPLHFFDGDRLVYRF
jgi:hypothetical protein